MTSNIFSFDGFIPVVHDTAFIHPNVTVTGNVIIGRDVYVGPGAAIRGDWGGIVIGDGCKVQENCTIHMFPGVTVVLESGAHVGHGAVVHGAHSGANALIGMNAVIMDNASVGNGCIVGALCFVPAGMHFASALPDMQPMRATRQASSAYLPRLPTGGSSPWRSAWICWAECHEQPTTNGPTNTPRVGSLSTNVTGLRTWSALTWRRTTSLGSAARTFARSCDVHTGRSTESAPRSRRC